MTQEIMEGYSHQKSGRNGESIVIMIVAFILIAAAVHFHRNVISMVVLVVALYGLIQTLVEFIRNDKYECGIKNDEFWWNVPGQRFPIPLKINSGKISLDKVENIELYENDTAYFKLNGMKKKIKVAFSGDNTELKKYLKKYYPHIKIKETRGS